MVESTGGREKQLLRAAIISELEAISQYEQAAGYTTDPRVRTVLLLVAKEEKTHVGEFLALLNSLDVEQANELENGLQEVEHV